MKTTKFSRYVKKLDNFVYTHRKYLILAYLIISIIFFFLQFKILNNWDMLVRILNSNYLFHGGSYFENQRALLESFTIGLLSFVFGAYAVYAFIALFTAIFFVAVYFFCKAFKIEYILVLGILLNPFFLFYAIKNGSELPMYSFLILFVSFIRLKKPIAGLFMALAFVSKYDSLFFLPLYLFIIDRNLLKSVKRILMLIGITLLALVPFFVYNALTYHDMFFSFFMSLNQNAPAVSSFSVSNASAFYTGFLELLVLVPLIFMVIFLNWKKLYRIIKNKIRDIAILSSMAALSMLIYIFASGLYVNGLGSYRFFLLFTVSLTLLLSLFTNRKMLLLTVLFFIVSVIIAYHMLLLQPLLSNTLTEQTSAAKTLLIQKYGTDNCTVQSNNWVYLDYYGISATYIRGVQNYSQYPIINFGKLSGNYTFYGEKDGIYLYTYGISNTKCSFTPVIDLKYGVNYYINLSRENSSLGCKMLYDKVHSSLVFSMCKFIIKETN
jgi:hypothetical protein